MRLVQTAVIVVILGAIFAAAFGGGGVLLARNLPMVREGWSSRSWPSVQGEVQQSAAVAKPVVASTRRGTVGTHVLMLRYAYAVNNTVYTGTRRSLADEGIIRSQEFAESEAAALPVGTNVTVFYDPGNPSRSLLTRGVSAASVVGISIGLVLIAGGAGLVGVALRLRSHHVRRRAQRG